MLCFEICACIAIQTSKFSTCYHQDAAEILPMQRLPRNNPLFHSVFDGWFDTSTPKPTRHPPTPRQPPRPGTERFLIYTGPFSGHRLLSGDNPWIQALRVTEPRSVIMECAEKLWWSVPLHVETHLRQTGTTESVADNVSGVGTARRPEEWLVKDCFPIRAV